MAQYEYQILEQAGGRVSHLNDRLAALVEEGFHPVLMTGTSPQVSVMLRRPTAPAAPVAAPAAAAVAAPRPPQQ